MRMRLATAMVAVLLAARANAATLAHARELVDQARTELQAVLTAEDSTAADRTAALALLQKLNGEAATTPAAQPAGKLVDNGDGTATDPASGLMWPVKDSGGTMAYAAAVDHCKLIKRGKHNDWRIPTLDELGSLQNDSFEKFKLSPLIHLSGCAPWVTVDNRSRGSNLEIDFCTGDRGVVIPEKKLAAVLCVRGPG